MRNIRVGDCPPSRCQSGKIPNLSFPSRIPARFRTDFACSCGCWGHIRLMDRMSVGPSHCKGNCPTRTKTVLQASVILRTAHGKLLPFRRRQVIELYLQEHTEPQRHRPIRSGKSHAGRNVEHIIVILLSLLSLAGCGVAGGTSTSSTTGKTATTSSPQIAVVPNSVGFGNVTVGVTNTQTVTVTNSGGSSLTLSQANLSGTGFSISGITLPVTVNPGQQTNFNVAFDPTSASNFTGSLSLVSNSPDSPTAIPLSGTGVTANLQLSVNPTSLNFGNVTVGQTSTQSVTVSNSGNSNIDISQVNVTGAGFSSSGLSAPVTLNPGQNATISVVFAPTTAGTVAGSISIVSNAGNSPTTVALTGSGVTTTSHSVALNWTASTSTVAGYNVYRGSQSGGTYTKVNSSLITGTAFSDSTVQAGQTYYYVTTAVDSNNVESAYSNEVSAVIPTP
jgi:hypothetical protein